MNLLYHNDHTNHDDYNNDFIIVMQPFFCGTRGYCCGIRPDNFPALANEIDFIGMASPLIREADLPNRWLGFLIYPTNIIVLRGNRFGTALSLSEPLMT